MIFIFKCAILSIYFFLLSLNGDVTKSPLLFLLSNPELFKRITPGELRILFYSIKNKILFIDLLFFREKVNEYVYMLDEP